MMILVFIIILILIISIIAMIYLEQKNVKYVKSNIDKIEYLVRDLPDKQSASDILARIKKNMIHLTNYLYKNKTGKYKLYEKYIDQLNDRIKNVKINESDEYDIHTSYTVNKGEQIVYCLRSKNNNNEIHNFNLIMYVVLHEMAHIASPIYGHDDTFDKLFYFLTNKAIELGLYNKINFEKTPIEYCGLVISKSII